jgi:DNA-binding transcriptional MocR family regulator
VNLRILESQLSSSAKVLMIRIAIHADYGRSTCWASRDTLAAELGFSSRHVGNLFAELEQAGWIEIERRSDSKHSQRTIKLPARCSVQPAAKEVGTTVPTGLEPQCQPVGTTVPTKVSSKASRKQTAGSIDPGGGNPGTDQAELARIKADVEIPTRAEIPALVATARQRDAMGLTVRNYLHDLVTSGKIPAEWVDADVLVLASSTGPPRHAPATIPPDPGKKPSESRQTCP